jgi:hypothetical protein
VKDVKQCLSSKTNECTDCQMRRTDKDDSVSMTLQLSVVFCFKLFIVSVMRAVCSMKSWQRGNGTHCGKTQNMAQSLSATIGA